MILTGKKTGTLRYFIGTPKSFLAWTHYFFGDSSFVGMERKLKPPLTCIIAYTPLLPSGKLTQLWKITVFNGKIYYKWPFSIAMLNYQRVPSGYPVIKHGTGIASFYRFFFWPKKKPPIHMGLSTATWYCFLRWKEVKKILSVKGPTKKKNAGRWLLPKYPNFRSIHHQVVQLS